jgi:periplasmic protein TonB
MRKVAMKRASRTPDPRPAIACFSGTIMMPIQRVFFLLSAVALAGCASKLPDILSPLSSPFARNDKGDATASRGGSSSSLSYEGYKRDLAVQISEANAGKVYSGRPQALLRSVVVVKYVIDARGNLVRSELMRSNKDRETESTALAALRQSAPFPKPAPHLLRQGRIEISETWLFNNDGRFQLRTIAQPQMDS